MSIDQDCMYAQIVPSGQEGTRISTGLLQFRNNFAVQKQVCVFAFVCMFVRTCAIACAHISVYLCVCVWCVCVCVCVCVNGLGMSKLVWPCVNTRTGKFYATVDVGFIITPSCCGGRSKPKTR